MRLFSDVWSENAALFERLMEIHSNLLNYAMALKVVDPSCSLKNVRMD